MARYDLDSPTCADVKQNANNSFARRNGWREGYQAKKNTYFNANHTEEKKKHCYQYPINIVYSVISHSIPFYSSLVSRD